MDEATILKSIEQAKELLKAESYRMSIGELINIYDDEELVIDPEFQRLFRWNDDQKTAFIETILLGLPYPPIFVFQRKDSIWELIDGLQRVSTIVSFFGKLRDEHNGEIKNGWMCTKAEIIKELKGLTYENLPNSAKLMIKRSAINIQILTQETEQVTRLEIFNRINRQGSQLEAQEVRNSFYRNRKNSDKVFAALKECSENDNFMTLIDSINSSKIEAKYDQELVLRFFCLMDFDKDDVLKGDLTSSLDGYLRKMTDDMTEREIDKKIDEFVRIVGILCRLDMPNEIFRSKTSKNKQFMTSYYDSFMVGIARNLHLATDNQKITTAIESLIKKDDFTDLSKSSYNSLARIASRLTIAVKHFANKLK